MTLHTIEKTLILASPPSIVWSHLTDPEKLSVWFHRPDHSLAQSGPFSMPGADGAPLVWGNVTEAQSPTRLAYEFSARPMGDLVTHVVWTLTAVEAGTRLHLTHSGIPQDGAGFGLLTAFDGGWDAHLLDFRKAMSPD